MNWKTPEKPKSQKKQIDILWDVVCNGVMHRLGLLDIKFGFVLALLGVMMAFLAILVFR